MVTDISNSFEGDEPLTIIGISFGDVYRSQEFLTAITRMSANGDLRLKDAVIVAKKDDGTTVVRETVDLQTGRTALSGAMWTGLLGLLVGGPVGWIAGIGIGAGRGRSPPRSSTSECPTNGSSGSGTPSRPGRSPS